MCVINEISSINTATTIKLKNRLVSGMMQFDVNIDDEWFENTPLPKYLNKSKFAKGKNFQTTNVLKIKFPTVATAMQKMFNKTAPK